MKKSATLKMVVKPNVKPVFILKTNQLFKVYFSYNVSLCFSFKFCCLLYQSKAENIIYLFLISLLFHCCVDFFIFIEM